MSTPSESVPAPVAALCTLGCKVNQYETQAISERLASLGFRIAPFDTKCDVYIVNTCTVTQESDKKSRQMIRRARKCGGPEAVVAAVGCFSQAQKAHLTELHALDAAFGNAEKGKVAETVFRLWQEKRKGRSFPSMLDCVTDISAVSEYEPLRISASERTRAFVKIVDGCENKCAYCIIPRVRGKIRSRAPDDVLDELRRLAAAGYLEVVLTGIETAAYGKDLPDVDLPALLSRAEAIDGIARIRLGSLEPTVIDERFVRTVSGMQKAVPHFHLSLQSGSDAVLRAMRRKYNTAMFREKLAMLRAALPRVTFTTDIIVGFPGETDEMFAQTCEFVRQCGFLYVHIFPFSARTGTEAAKMEADPEKKVPEPVKKARAAQLHKVMLEARRSVLRSFDGYETEVLIEEQDADGACLGHTPHYIEAKLQPAFAAGKDPRAFLSKIVPCRLYDDGHNEFMRCEPTGSEAKSETVS